MERLKKYWLYLRNHQFLYCLLLPIFIGLFFATSDREHRGELAAKNFVYHGQIYQDKPNGKGKLLYKNGDCYEGEFHNGQFEGQGFFSSKSGKWSYQGTFQAGFLNGEGVLTTSDGKSHKGKFVKGLLEKEEGK